MNAATKAAALAAIDVTQAAYAVAFRAVSDALEEVQTDEARELARGIERDLNALRLRIRKTVIVTGGAT